MSKQYLNVQSSSCIQRDSRFLEAFLGAGMKWLKTYGSLVTEGCHFSTLVNQYHLLAWLLALFSKFFIADYCNAEFLWRFLAEIFTHVKIINAMWIATRRRHHPLNWPPSGQGHTVKLIMHFSFDKKPMSLCWLVIFACLLAKPTHFSLQLVDCKIEKVEVSILMMNYGLCNYEFQTSFFVFVLHGRHAHHVVQNWFHPDRV